MFMIGFFKIMLSYLHKKYINMKFKHIFKKHSIFFRLIFILNTYIFVLLFLYFNKKTTAFIYFVF